MEPIYSMIVLAKHLLQTLETSAYRKTTLVTLDSGRRKQSEYAILH